jgi:predicted transglutaminase-like cysteine proteinase
VQPDQSAAIVAPVQPSPAPEPIAAVPLATSSATSDDLVFNETPAVAGGDTFVDLVALSPVASSEDASPAIAFTDVADPALSARTDGRSTAQAQVPAMSDAAVGAIAPQPMFLSWSSKADTTLLSEAMLRSSPAPASSFALEAPQAAPVLPTPEEPAGPLMRNHALMSLLGHVNDRVNGAIRYMSDVQQYGVDDYWTLPLEAGASAAGDCKDYVLEKRRALIDAGLPAADLSIAIVKTSWGEMHAVLLVATDRGELVMDSLSSRIAPWRDAPYTWVERQAPGEQLTWVKIVGARPTAASYFSL